MSEKGLERLEGPSRIGTAIAILLCVTLIYNTVLYGGVDTGVLTLASITTSLLLILWGIHSWRTGEFCVYYTNLYFPIGALLALGLIQLLPLRNVDQLSEVVGIPASATLSLDPYATRFFVIRVVIYVIFFAAAVTFINSEKRVRRMAWFIIVFGSILAFFGILQWLTKPEAIYGLRLTPQAIPFGPFINQHHFAGLMEMTGGLTLGILLGSGIKTDKKPLLIIALVLMSVATILTGSRGGVLSFTATAAFALMLTFAFKENKGSAGKISSKLTVWLLPAIGLSLAILIAMLLVIALGGEQNLLRGTGLRNAQTDFTSGRAGFWKVAWQIFLSHPILGAGLDAFGAAFTKFDPSSGLFRVEQAHNDYLQMLADGGIAAFACVIAFIYLLFRNGIRRIRDGLGSLDKSIVIGALAGCFGIMVHSLMDFPLRTPANAFFFLTLVSMAAAKVSPEKSSYSSEIR